MEATYYILKAMIATCAILGVALMAQIGYHSALAALDAYVSTNYPAGAMTGDDQASQQLRQDIRDLQATQRSALSGTR